MMSTMSTLDWIFAIVLAWATWMLNSTIYYRTFDKARKAVHSQVNDRPAETERLGALDETLQRIQRSGCYLNLDSFTEGSKHAYEQISSAVASGRLDDVSFLLAPDTRDVFERCIAERQQSGISIEMFFIGFVAAEPIDAGLNDRVAWIEMRFVVQIITVTRGADGLILAGNPRRVTTIAEAWTFARDVDSQDPNWSLVATRDEE